MLKKLFARKQNKNPKAHIIPRAEHTFSRQRVSKNALTVLYRLNNAGFQAYLVGGCVRDILLNITPKDFDVATDATPEELRRLFRNCRLIGRRFRLAHIYFGRDIIEVATFRTEPSKMKFMKHQSESGRILRDNVYGDITSDALRRDFTINALYYNIADFSIVDYCKGIDDIESRTLTLIGDPVTRYREDPVRILRAIRFSAKLDLDISAATAKPIKSSLKLLPEVPSSRIYEESLKLLLTGHSIATMKKLREYGIHAALLPPSKHYTEQDWAFIEQGLANTDSRIKSRQTTSPGFLFALLLWPGYLAYCQKLLGDPPYHYGQKHEAMDKLLQDVNKALAIPKRFTLMSRSIWDLQDRLLNVKKHQAFRLLSHPSFRAAYDFLELRGQFDKELKQSAQWWHRFQNGSDEQQDDMLEELPKAKGRRRQRKPRAQQDENV